MGLRIDNARASIDALAIARAPRVNTGEPRDTPLRRAQGVTEPVTLQPGFGENTINLASASLNTLGSNLRRVREVVPTVDELREQARERFREENAQAAPRTSQGDRVEFSAASIPEEAPSPRIGAVPSQEQPVRPEPAPQAREFEPPPPEPESGATRLDVRI